MPHFPGNGDPAQRAAVRIVIVDQEHGDQCDTRALCGRGQINQIARTGGLQVDLAQQGSARS